MMPPMIFALVVLGGLYAVELIFFGYAARLSRKQHRSTDLPAKLPRVSVIVAAKDEERNLPSCLASIVKLDYPARLLEVIIVNDQSNDGTPGIIDSYRARYEFVRRVDAKESTEMRGKANALSQGIDAASGELIFMTDADCTVQPSWIGSTLKYFNENTGIVGGVTHISRTENLVAGIQALDWDFLLNIGAGLATVGKPLACLGNNLVFRKKAYDEVGGYRRIRFSVTEDYALFKSIAESGKWTYRYPMDRENLVETLPVATLKEVFAQRKRWATGGKDTGLPGRIVLAPGFLLHWAILASLLISPIMFVVSFAVKTIMDAVFIVPTLKFYGKIAHLKFILYFEIYYLIYVAILPFSVYLGKAVTWKGRKY